jgi:hypothetical protein
LSSTISKRRTPSRTPRPWTDLTPSPRPSEKPPKNNPLKATREDKKPSRPEEESANPLNPKKRNKEKPEKPEARNGSKPLCPTSNHPSKLISKEKKNSKDNISEKEKKLKVKMKNDQLAKTPAIFFFLNDK